VVFGHDLTTEAALTKLSFLLALPGLSYEDIVNQMQYSIRGEITEMVTEQFKHPGSDIPTIPVSSIINISLRQFHTVYRYKNIYLLTHISPVKQHLHPLATPLLPAPYQLLLIYWTTILTISFSPQIMPKTQLYISQR